MHHEALSAEIFRILREMDHAASTLRDGFPTGLRWYHGHLSELQRPDRTEDLISRDLGLRLADFPGIAGVELQKRFDGIALDDGISRGTCDVVIRLDSGSEVWIEVKGAWTYLLDKTTRLPHRNPSFKKHLVETADGAARDFLKLDPLVSPSAKSAAVLLVGFDVEEAYPITEDHLGEMLQNARASENGWTSAYDEWPDSNAARVFASEQELRPRTRCWLWTRGLDCSNRGQQEQRPMTIDEAIRACEQHGATRGKTATPGSANYERSLDLEFRLCECSRDDPDWPFPDYIAKTDQGAHLYVGIDSRQMSISCGPKGYHSAHYRNTPPCI